MKVSILQMYLMFWITIFSLNAQTNERYIEVTGTSEVETAPDKIHYIIEIQEYFEEEFDGKSKPEEYRTKVPLSWIERRLMWVLETNDIPRESVRIQEIGDYWRKQGQDFLISKQLDITLQDFKQIDAIVKHVDTRGIRTMRCIFRLIPVHRFR